MKIIFNIVILITALSVSSHEVNLKNYVTEEIINTRMKEMSSINNLSQKIYKQLNLADFTLLKNNTIKLKHSAIDFKKLFPINSKGGKAKNLIWEDRILFNEYNDNFLNDINFMLIDIENKDIVSLKKNFNDMSTNCSSCHKKFKNK